jgi:hypothetical protein
MITTFNLSADDLDMSVLRSIKEAFKGKKIEIIISDASGSGEGNLIETRIRNLKKDKNTVRFSEDDFFKTYRKKVSDASNQV